MSYADGNPFISHSDIFKGRENALGLADGVSLYHSQTASG